MPLRDQWPWNQAYLKLFLITPTLFSIIAAVMFTPKHGSDALYWLLAIPCGYLFKLVYALVGKKVTALKETLSNQDNNPHYEYAESLIVIDKIQSPGVVVLRKNELVLYQITGRTLTVAFDDMRTVIVKTWLPGKALWGKRAFHISTYQDEKFGFAVAKPIADRWSEKLIP